MRCNTTSLLATASAALCLGATASPTSSATTATLASGDVVKGAQCPDTSAVRFRGIPYAQPPVDSLRFMPPKALSGPLTNSSHPQFDATKAAAPCLQYVELQFGVSDPTPSENCLTLDVYVPPLADKRKKLPVKVWAYGGFNQVGGTSYPLYDACTLATDAIVVAMNYRLGPMGFLTLASAGVQGNMAIQDQLLALRWVQDNIGTFGGDSDQVMMFGQSAGADDTWAIASLPEAKGLMKGAIIESGGGSFMTPYYVAQTVGGSFAELAGCGTDDLSCLQKASLETINKAYSNIPEINNNTSGAQRLSNIYSVNLPSAYSMSGAVLDGKIIKQEPFLVGPQVPLVAGSTETDTNLFVIPTLEGSGYPLGESNYTDFINSFDPEIGAQVAKYYPLSDFDHFNDTGAAVTFAISHIATMSSYVCPSTFAAMSAAFFGVDSYLYHFNHTPSCPWLINPGPGPESGAFPTGNLSLFFGPTHTSELPYVFGGLDKMPFGNGTCNSTEAEYKMSAQLVEAWTAVAASGSPATKGLPWPKFDPCENKGVLIEKAAQVAKLDMSECDFWAQVLQKYAGVKVPYLNRGNSSQCAARSTTGSPTGSEPPPTVPVSASGETSRVSIGALAGGLLFVLGLII